MDILDFKNDAPEKYWSPTGGTSAMLKDIFARPQNYKDYLVGIKKDGYWSRVFVNGDNSLVQSRTVSRTTRTYGDNTEKVPHILEELNALFPNSVFLGEMAFPEDNATSKEVTSILGCKPPKAIERQKTKPLHFYIFDCLVLCGEDLSKIAYGARINALKTKTEGKFVHFLLPCGMDKFEEVYTDIMSKGGEGVVLHLKSRLYQPGKRPARQSIKIKKATETLTLKVKRTVAAKKLYEGSEIINWQYWEKLDGEKVKGSYYGSNFIAVTKPYFYGWVSGVVVDNNGVEVSVTSGMTDELRERCATELPDTVDVSAMEITSDGSLRHPYLTGATFTA